MINLEYLQSGGTLKALETSTRLTILVFIPLPFPSIFSYIRGILYLSIKNKVYL